MFDVNMSISNPHTCHMIELRLLTHTPVPLYTNLFCLFPPFRPYLPPSLLPLTFIQLFFTLVLKNTQLTDC